MTLDDLLWYVNDSCIVQIFIDAEEVGYYDGKDSIPEEYLEREVTNLYAESIIDTWWLARHGEVKRIPALIIELQED